MTLARRLASEGIGTALLLAAVVGSGIMGERFSVGGYMPCGYWFTASTSLAMLAVALARSFSNTFAGIRPADAPGFIVAQRAGVFAAAILFRWLVPVRRGLV